MPLGDHLDPLSAPNVGNPGVPKRKKPPLVGGFFHDKELLVT